MKLLNYIFIISLAILIVGCNGNTKSESDEKVKSEEKKEDQGTNKETKSESDESKIYKVKSGHLMYNTTMGMTIETWFDDYGNTQYTESLIEIMGQKSGSYSYIIDGYRYDYNVGEIEGRKAKYYAAQSYNYDNVTQKEIDKYGLEFYPDETIQGKTCEVISIESPVESKVWIWEGIPMKTVSKLGKEDFVMEIVEIETGSVDKSKFELPEGVTFIEQ